MTEVAGDPKTQVNSHSKHVTPLFCGFVEMWRYGEGRVSGLRSSGIVAKYYRLAILAHVKCDESS